MVSPHHKRGGQNMPEEEKKMPVEVPVPPSGEEPKADEPPKAEKPAEAIDYKAELEKKAQEIVEKDKEISRLGFRNRSIEKVLADSGIEVPGREGLTEDSVKEIVKQSVQEAIKPLTDELTATKTELSEAKRALAGKETEDGGNGAGQKPPIKKPMPSLSEEDKKLVRRIGLKWDSEKGVFITPSGRICDLNSKEGLALEIPAE